MSHQSASPRRVAPWLPLLLAACAATPPAVVVSPVLQPEGATRLVATLAATGVQIYECRNGAAGAAPQWVFVAPEAALFNELGRRVGDHGAGPFWQAHDGSRIVGTVQARADAPQAGSIPWLLLKAQSTGTPGLLSAVTHVQRIHTQGGLAPAEGCNPERVGSTARVPYRADYRLVTSA